jgi:isoaspartyl peptidase/L-asparaginase-like protein (Ntn-hydrolase superfamily)
MKTERMTLLIAPDDKAAIAARAEALGMSVSELVRQAAMGFDPEERAYLDALAALVPQLREAAGDMRNSLTRALDAAEETKKFMEDRPAYRAQVHAEISADPTINWPGIQHALGLDVLARSKAA